MAHTVQLQYAVDYYFMNYTAHFFALIHPRKVQYVHILYFAQEDQSKKVCHKVVINCITVLYEPYRLH